MTSVLGALLGEQERDPLELYIAYDFLPAQQAGAIIHQIGSAYELLLPAFAPYPDVRGFPRRFGPPLAVEYAQTGQSIKVGFGPPKKFFPTFQFDNEDLKVLLPRWSAVAVLAGAALVGGLEVGSSAYEFMIKQHEYQRIRQEEVLQRLDPASADSLTRLHRQFQDTISTPNIDRITLNDFPARQDNTRVGPR